MKKFQKITLSIIIFLIINIPIIILVLNISFRELPFCETSEKPIFVGSSMIIKQEYTPSGDNIVAVGIKPVKYNSIVNDYLKMDIMNASGEIIYSKKIYNLPLEDNQINYISIPKNLLKKNERYLFGFSRPNWNDKKNPISLWDSKEKCFDGNLFIANEIKDNNLIMNFKYEKYDFLTNLKVLKNRLVQYKPAIIKGYFVPIVFALYEISLLILATVLVKSYFSGKSGE